MPVSSRWRPCELISTTNRKCHKLFAVFLVNIWIVQSCYFVHCLHLPRCLYYTQCHHSMSSFSQLPYLHYLLHHLHRCINFLLIFPTVLALIFIVLTSITAINAIAKVFASIYIFLIFITVYFFSSSVFLLLFFILMGVVLIVIIVSIIIGIILEDTSCSCLIHQFILFLFFCLPSPLLHHCLHTHGCCSNIHHRFYYTRSHLLLLFSSISLFYSYSSISPFSLLLSSFPSSSSLSSYSSMGVVLIFIIVSIYSKSPLPLVFINLFILLISSISPFSLLLYSFSSSSPLSSYSWMLS